MNSREIATTEGVKGGTQSVCSAAQRGLSRFFFWGIGDADFGEAVAEGIARKA